MPEDILAPCSLYCAVCLDNVVNHACHGCGCACGKCAGVPHVEQCGIGQCAAYFADDETKLQWAFIEHHGRERYRAFPTWKADLEHEA